MQTWDADTEHWSVYLMFEWQIIEQLKLTLENRYVDETFEITKPNQSGCTNLGFAVPGFFGLLAPLGVNSVGIPPNQNPDPGYYQALCQSVNFDEDSDNDPNSTTFNTWEMINGTEDTDFNAPKVTVEWTPSDNALLYFSWAHAEKPGGISQISSGGTASTIDDERFLPEEMDAWELGTKTSWEAAGGLQVNGSVFFNDYTDKQVGTQVLVADPLQGGALISQPRVINAAAAEVWGVELDLLWQPSFLEGLSISLAYTWLDPTYTDFIDETSSVVRAAMNGSCPVVYTGGENPANPDDKTDPTNGAPKCALNMSGHQLERTPENSFVSMIGLQRPLFNTGIDWFVEGNTTYQDKRFESVDNWTYFEDHWLTDIRLGLQADRWDALLYINNVFDDDTIKSGGSQPDFGEQDQLLGFTAGLGVNGWHGTLPPPRVIGVRANFRFGG